MSSTSAAAAPRQRSYQNSNSNNINNRNNNSSHHNNNKKRPRDRNRKRKADAVATAAAAAALKTCTECHAQEPKYKCPKCREPYCSIECCRVHKTKNCQGSTVQDTATTTTTITSGNSGVPAKKSKYLPSDLLICDPVQNSHLQRIRNDDNEEDLEEGWQITKEMMDSMDKSDWLRNELQDGGLRQMIHQICASSVNVMPRSGTTTRGTTFQQEMLISLQTKYPNFAVFLDKLKVLTGVLERQNLEEEEPLGDWLEYSTPDTMGPLALKLLPSRRADVEFPPIDAQTSSEEDHDQSSSEEDSSDEESETSSSSSE